MPDLNPPKDDYVEVCYDTMTTVYRNEDILVAHVKARIDGKSTGDFNDYLGLHSIQADLQIFPFCCHYSVMILSRLQ